MRFESWTCGKENSTSPPTEVAPIIFDHKGGIGAGVVEPNTSLDQINGRGEEGFYIQCEGIVLIFGRLNENWKNRDPQSFHTSSLT